MSHKQNIGYIRCSGPAVNGKIEDENKFLKERKVLIFIKTETRYTKRGLK